MITDDLDEATYYRALTKDALINLLFEAQTLARGVGCENTILIARLANKNIDEQARLINAYNKGFKDGAKGERVTTAWVVTDWDAVREQDILIAIESSWAKAVKHQQYRKPKNPPLHMEPIYKINSFELEDGWSEESTGT